MRAGRFVDGSSLLASLEGYVLLGEKHDNADHHALQAELLRATVANAASAPSATSAAVPERSGRKPVVAFEMFDVDVQSAIDAARAASPRDAAGVAKAANWDASGWPPWALYAPIAQVALDDGLPIVATGLSRTRLRAMMKPATGPESGTPSASATAPPDEGVPLSPEQQASLAEELRASHCGHLPEAMLPAMMRMQRARDVSMATELARAMDKAHADTGVLIAGTGHTRTDRGAGRDLAARDPHRSIRSVAFVEVEKGKIDPADYAERWNAARLPFDFVWFTPRANDDDPCAMFKQGS